MPKLMEKRDWIQTVANVSSADMPKRKSAHDFIGYCRKFNPEYRSTAEIMRELREGEEDDII